MGEVLGRNVTFPQFSIPSPGYPAGSLISPIHEEVSTSPLLQSTALEVFVLDRTVLDQTVLANAAQLVTALTRSGSRISRMIHVRNSLTGTQDNCDTLPLLS